VKKISENILAILITGKGKLGKELVKLFPSSLNPSRNEMDIINKEQISNFLDHKQLDIVIHTAALTSQINCENDPSLAWAVNVNGTQNMISHIKTTNPNCLFVFISSPAIFKCDIGSYSESDVPNPINQYGLTKLVGESLIQSLKNYLIIRTNFVERNWKPEKSFTDRYGTYLYSDTVARAIKELIEKQKSGIIHVCGAKKISMFDLAKRSNPDVEPISLDTFDDKSTLAKDMSLISKSWHPYNIEID